MTKEALHKIENFVKVALSEISTLKGELESSKVKEAAEISRQDKELEQALKKAAEAMYSADFINDEDEKSMFVKKAKEDSKYLARIVEKVCNAADVAYMGKSASVKSSNQTDDPVMRRAFGYDVNYSLLDD
jgi:hypothetical protein